MNLKFSKSLNFAFIVILLVTLVSCNSVKQPSSIPQKINYSDEDIVQNEIERINGFMEKTPVKALWRAVLLDRADVIDKCVKNLQSLIEKAYEDEDFYLADKYGKSLETIGFPLGKYSRSEINKIKKNDVPGLTGINNKAPQNIEDCIKATCTIWVDRGLKVKHGSGYADIIIGSGFFIDKRGYLVTNYHVIESMVDPKYEGYSRLYIRLPEDMDHKIQAKVVGYDKTLDLALLKVEIEPEFVFNLGSSSGLRVGAKISAIGTPIGLEGTLTSGIISATDRKLLNLGDVFQIDAAVNSGNSGGPLIDENMNVQAVVFAGMLEFQGLNFAIPVEYLKQMLGFMYTKGEIVHPWISAFGHTKKHGSKKTGLEVQYVVPGGSSFLSGLSEGDVIIEFDGNPITCLEDFQLVMLSCEPETLLKCKYMNKKEEVKECYVYLEKRPIAPALLVYNCDFFTGSFLPLFGMKLISSSTSDKNAFTVDYVLPGTVADQLNFSNNDQIEVKDVVFNSKSEEIDVQIVTRRRKKGFLDISLLLGADYDSPYYF